MTFPNGFEPMLSGKAPDDLSAINFPVLVSPKLDGIRCIMWGGVAYSRKLKPIPNEWIQNCLNTLPDGLDGELIVGPPTNQPGPMKAVETDNGVIHEKADSVMQRTSSGVMSRDGRPDFLFHIFDWYGSPEGFVTRRADIAEEFHGENRDGLPIANVPHTMVYDLAELLALEDKYVKEGYEGVMIRDPLGAYKCGRSTTREGGLLKLKRFFDAEARIVDFVEQMHNANVAEKDNLGRTKRSTAKAGKVPKGTLGALVCEMDTTVLRGDYLHKYTVRFEIGTGFTEAQRQQIWNEREGYRGSLTKFKYQELTPDGVPRFPVWLDFRSEIDT